MVSCQLLIMAENLKSKTITTNNGPRTIHTFIPFFDWNSERKLHKI